MSTTPTRFVSPAEPTRHNVHIRHAVYVAEVIARTGYTYRLSASVLKRSVDSAVYNYLCDLPTGCRVSYAVHSRTWRIDRWDTLSGSYMLLEYVRLTTDVE